MSNSVTNASLQTTIGRINVLTRIRQAQTTTEMGNLWLNGSSSSLTDETPAAILDKLTGKKTSLQLNLRDAERARDMIANRVNEVEPTLTQSLIDHADLISRNIVKRSPAEFIALRNAWKYNVISLHAEHVALERAFAVYPKLFPGQRITFLADDLMKLDTQPSLENQKTLDERFKFIVNHVRNEHVIKERFGLTSELVRSSVTAGRLSTTPFLAIHRNNRKRAWLRIELGASLALVAGLTVGGFVSHLMDKETLGTLLWILAFDPGLGFSALAADHYLDHQRSDLFSKPR